MAKRINIWWVRGKMGAGCHFSTKTFFAPYCSRTPTKAPKNFSARFGTGKGSKNRISWPFIFQLPYNPMAFEKVCHEDWPLSRNWKHVYFKMCIRHICAWGRYASNFSYFGSNFCYNMPIEISFKPGKNVLVGNFWLSLGPLLINFVVFWRIKKNCLCQQLG